MSTSIDPASSKALACWASKSHTHWLLASHCTVSIRLLARVCWDVSSFIARMHGGLAQEGIAEQWALQSMVGLQVEHVC